MPGGEEDDFLPPSSLVDALESNVQELAERRLFTWLRTDGTEEATLTFAQLRAATNVAAAPDAATIGSCADADLRRSRIGCSAPGARGRARAETERQRGVSHISGECGVSSAESGV